MAKFQPMSTQSVFCDSNIWIAWFNKNDHSHQKAKEIINNLPEDVSILTSNLIIYEVLTVLSMRAGKNKSLKFGQWLFPLISKGFISVEYIDEAIEDKTWSIFQTLKNKDISFADCATVAIAKDFNAVILTFDNHFKILKRQFGVKLF